MPHRLFRNKGVYVADSVIHGRGVFVDQDLLPGEIIEQCPVVQPLDRSRKMLVDPEYTKYFFSWPGLCQDWKKEVDERGYLDVNQISYLVCVLGYGMIYNHSSNPNVIFEVDSTNNVVEFRAKRKINANEELLICYGDHVKF